ncbi:hypothetical protein MRX96_032279 [Rhipicephalus microplus]
MVQSAMAASSRARGLCSGGVCAARLQGERERRNMQLPPQLLKTYIDSIALLLSSAWPSPVMAPLAVTDGRSGRAQRAVYDDDVMVVITLFTILPVNTQLWQGTQMDSILPLLRV